MLIFLLTHPVWDVTRLIAAFPPLSAFLLTHPVWDVTILKNIFNPIIQFLLTHPVWDVTSYASEPESEFKISTHTSRVGCDKTGA